MSKKLVVIHNHHKPSDLINFLFKIQSDPQWWSWFLQPTECPPKWPIKWSISITEAHDKSHDI